MLELPLQRLLSMQNASGAFASMIEKPGIRVADENCFSTAQVALLLGDLRLRIGDPDRKLASAHGRALDFVEHCADPRLPGAFAFYPHQNTPGSSPLGTVFNPDIDDTALAWMALVRGKRRSRDQLRNFLPQLLTASTVCAARRGDPPGTSAPLLRTWMHVPGLPEPDPNPVDLIANLNVLSCFALSHSKPSMAWLLRLKQWLELCDGSRSWMRSLSPYYVEGVELEIALRRSVQLGTQELSPALTHLSRLGLESYDQRQGRPETRALYCNSHGSPKWYCAALQHARYCADLSQPPARRLRHPFPTANMRETHVVHA